MAAPIQVIIAAYSDQDEAGRRLAELKEGRRAGLVGIIDAAAVSKAADGELKVTNAKHRGRRGLLTGGVVGALIGVMAGPVGWAAAGGGVLGGLSGRLRSAPFKTELLGIGEELPPGSSVLIAAVEHTWVEQLRQELQAAEARLVMEELRADIVEQLEAGGNVAFTLAEDGMATMGARVASSPDGATAVSGFLSTEDGVAVAAAELTEERLSAGSVEQG